MNYSDTKTVSKNINLIKSVVCTVTDNCTVSDPVVLLRYDTDLVNCNYAYVQDFGKYYYCSAPVLIPGNMMQINMHRDVLMTYSAGIYNVTSVIARQENSGLTLIPDANICVQNYQVVDNIPFPVYLDNSFGSYCLTVVGGA